MKPLPLLLVGSLLANLVLCFVVVTGNGRGSDSSTAAQTAATAPAAPRPAANPDHPDPETWTGLTTGDPAAIAAQLREQGFPLSLQRAILAALITERFADRHKALADMISAQPWWRGNLYSAADGAKILTARQQLQREEKEALEQILGPDAGVSDYNRARRARSFGGDLAAGKGGELDRINADYNELISEVRNGSQGILLPEDRAKLAYLEEQKRADITKLLSPEELLEYDLRSSASSNQLRNQLAAFGPTEEEFRALFKLQQAFDTKYGNPEFLSAEQRRDRNLAQAELLKQAEGVLPADRFAELKMKTDGAYLAANAVVTRLQLPPTATAEIVAVQKDISKRADAIRMDRTLTTEQRTSQFQALGSEAVARLTPTLGDAGLNAYKNSGGGWISGLLRPPTPPPAPQPKQ
jgi:hypothetical protein